MSDQDGLLLIDAPEEYEAAKPDVQADAMNEAKESRNSLYWQTRCLRAERVGTLANVESLTQALERIRELIGEARASEDEETTAVLLRRMDKRAKIALDAVWGRQ